MARRAGWSAAELAATAAWLGHDDSRKRAAAVAAIAQLRPDSTPAVETRIRQLAALDIDADRARASLAQLARAGALRSADPTAGALAVLAEQRGPDMRAVVEALLLLHALSRMNTTRAGLLMAEWVELYDGAFSGALSQVSARAGSRLLPALIVLRSDRSQPVKRWAQAEVRALRAVDPRAALDREDPQQMAEVVLAYTTPLDFDALPILVRLTGHRHLQVRAAARTAVTRFGKNAIWQLREFYEELIGERAERSWSATQLANKLYQVLDRPGIEADRRALDQGLACARKDDLGCMEVHFDRVLRSWPSPAVRAEMAPGYAAIAEAALVREDLPQAESALRTALHLLPEDSPHRLRYAAQLRFVRAERDLAQGVVDREAYRQVLALHPGHDRARRVLDRLNGEGRTRDAQHRRWLAVAALLLLAGAGGLFWGSRKALAL